MPRAPRASGVARASPRQFFERHIPSLWEVMRTVISAALVSFLLEIVVLRPTNARQILALLFAYPLAVGFALLVGMYLGRRVWPRRGRRLARRVLKRTIAGRRRPILYLTDRPDFIPSIPRRIFEVVGFAAGVSIIVPATLQMFGVGGGLVPLTGGILTLLALWGSFVLVPYWVFARLGIREIDPVRWLVQPMSRKYADRMRLSNGALLILAVGAAVNLAFRAGASGDAALVSGFLTVTRLSASILVVAAAGVAYFSRVEKQIVRSLEEEALQLGILDGRGMSDGDFLPKVPRRTG